MSSVSGDIERLSALSPFLDQTARELHNDHPATPGFQWAVVYRHDLVANGAIGLADANSGEPMATTHAMQAASNAKPLAAVASCILAERGVVDLDTPVTRLVRSWRRPNGMLSDQDLERMTLRALHSHTSGLGVRGYPQIPWDHPSPPSAEDIIAGWFGADFGLAIGAPPGGTALYSAAGFTLAQIALEAVTATPYSRLFDELITRPLGLQRFWIGRREPLAPLAAQHDEQGRRLTHTFYPALAASGLYASAADLAAFYARFSSLLKPAGVRELLRPHGHADGGWAFGLGFALAECNHVHICKHAGWSTGCWGAAEGIPGRGIGAAVLCNSAGGKVIVQSLLGAATQWLTTH